MLQEIEAKAKALNPSYTIFKRPSNESEANAKRLETRQTQAIHCNWPPGYSPAGTGANSGNANALQDGINYLRGISGSCRANPGPGSCGRVSCSYNVGIFYCNDN